MRRMFKTVQAEATATGQEKHVGYRSQLLQFLSLQMFKQDILNNLMI